jgi:hypothetical protein
MMHDCEKSHSAIVAAKDVASFFDSVSQNWLVRFVEQSAPGTILLSRLDSLAYALPCQRFADPLTGICAHSNKETGIKEVENTWEKVLDFERPIPLAAKPKSGDSPLL